MRLLDLFCGAGGASMGYSRAGFEVVGVDIVDQPDYPFTFHRADALSIPLRGFDAVHASPPCQGHSLIATNRYGGHEAPVVLEQVRTKCLASGLPYVIENVAGARRYLRSPFGLHGAMFGLAVNRPRLFECNLLLMSPPPMPTTKRPVAVYGDKGDGCLLLLRKDGTELRRATLDEARTAMGMEWVRRWRGVADAIPPAYTEWIGNQILEHLLNGAATAAPVVVVGEQGALGLDP